jgi:predicted nucleotidyltransferase
MNSPTTEQLNEVLECIVPAIHPLRIILFGSAARGEMGPDSDIDLLVIIPDGGHRLHTMEELHRLFMGLSFPVDVVVATPSDLQRRRNSPGFIYATALREGRELYAA